MKSILIIHSLNRFHRQTTFEFVMSFGRYAPSNTSVHYHNLRNPFPGLTIGSGSTGGGSTGSTSCFEVSGFIIA